MSCRQSKCSQLTSCQTHTRTHRHAITNKVLHVRHTRKQKSLNVDALDVLKPQLWCLTCTQRGPHKGRRERTGGLRTFKDFIHTQVLYTPEALVFTLFFHPSNWVSFQVCFSFRSARCRGVSFIHGKWMALAHKMAAGQGRPRIWAWKSIKLHIVCVHTPPKVLRGWAWSWLI